MGQETALLLERQERQRARAEQIGRLWAVHQFMQSDAPVCEVLKLLESSVSEETFVERLFVNDREIMFSGVSYETTFVSDFWGRMAHNMDASFRGRGAYLAEVPEISQEKRGHARAVTFRIVLKKE